MSENGSPASILLPCLRGQVEDWIYYVALLPYKEIARRFKPAEEIHHNKTLNELLQRALTKRSGEIGDYVLQQKQHFFNAIIAGIYEGEPRWIEVSLGQDTALHDEKTLEALSESIGALELTGNEKIFAIDGQHRVEGIKTALEKRHRHGSEEGTVIFVAHNSNKRGLERTRRLFSTLNRYAKPVKLGEIIALDEDDAIAILTRRLLYHHHFLRQEAVVAPSKTKNLPVNDRDSFTSIQALYDFLQLVLINSQGLSPKKIRVFKQLRPKQEELDKRYDQAVSILDAIISSFPEFAEYTAASHPGKASKLRGPHGGSLLFRPIGLSIIGQCIATCIRDGKTVSKTVKSLAKATRPFAQPPWKGFLYDAENSRMRPRISKSDIDVAARIWCHLGKTTPVDLPKLYSDYAGAMGITAARAKSGISKL